MLPGQLNFVRLLLLCMGLQYGTCLILRHRILRWLLDFLEDLFIPAYIYIYIYVYSSLYNVSTSSCAREELLVFHRAPPLVVDMGMLTRYGGYRGNKIPGADQN